MSRAREKITEKLNRTLSVCLASSEEIELEGGEKWQIFPLRTRDHMEIERWNRENPLPPEAPELEGGQEETELQRAARAALKQREIEWFDRFFFFVLWLSLRKNCLTPQEILECYATDEWPLSLEEVPLLLPRERIGDVTKRVFSFLGIAVRREGEGPAALSPQNGDGLGEPVVSSADQTQLEPAGI